MIHKINSDKQFTLPVDFKYCPLAIYIALRRPMLLGSVTTPVVRGSGKPSFFGARVVVDAALFAGSVDALDFLHPVAG